MTRRICLVIALMSAACAARTHVTPADSGPSPSARLAAADAQVKAGCFDCLLSAFNEYTSLRSIPAVADAALSEQGTWTRVTEVLTATAACLEDAEIKLTEEIAAIRTSSQPQERKDRQIAKREQQIATNRRRIVTSWFNTAVGYFNLSRTDEARRFAEKVADDEQFGERARDLLARIR